MNVTLSVGILTFNNEDTIERCLESIRSKYKILIIDSGSTDNTLNIAKKFGAEIIQNDFIDFAKQRNFLLSNASSDFVFFLDSDEAMTDEMIDFLQKSFSSISLQGNIFRVARTEYLDNKELASGYGRSGYQSRIVRRSVVSYVGSVHETPYDSENKKEVLLPFGIRILHNPSRDFDSMMRRLVGYSKLMSEKKISRNRKVNTLLILINFNWQFLRLAFLSRKEGYRGILSAWSEALARTITYLYVYADTKKKDI